MVVFILLINIILIISSYFFHSIQLHDKFFSPDMSIPHSFIDPAFL